MDIVWCAVGLERAVVLMLSNLVKLGQGKMELGCRLSASLRGCEACCEVWI